MSMAGFDQQIGRYVEATRRAGANRLLTLIHCEDFALLADAVAELTLAGQTVAAPLRRQPPDRLGGSRDAARGGDRRGDRRAGLRRPPLLRTGAGGLRGGAGARAAGLRRDAPALSAPDQRALRGAGWREVCRAAAAARGERCGGALARPPGRHGPHRLHRPRSLVAGGEARPRPLDRAACAPAPRICRRWCRCSTRRGCAPGGCRSVDWWR